MIEAMRLVSIQRGYDPSEFSLIAFGGAGPVHANRLADELGIPLVVVPPSPGVASAWGMLVSDLRHDYRTTRLQPLGQARFEELNAVYRGFERDARTALAREGVRDGDMVFQRSLDLRYVGQSVALTIQVPPTDLTPGDVPPLRTAFDGQHAQSYGYAVPEEPVEIVSVGVLAIGRVPKRPMRAAAGAATAGATATSRKPDRRVYFQESGGFVECPVYDRHAMAEHSRVSGPAIIEEPDSTTVLHPGYSAEIAPHGTLLIRSSAVDQGRR